MALPQEQDDSRNNPTRRIPANQRGSRSVDWRSKNDPQDPDTLTTSNAYKAAQQQRLTGERLLNRKIDAKEERKAERRRQKRVQKIARNRQKLMSIAASQGGVKGVAKIARKARVLQATWIAGGLCAGLYFYQVAFWILSMAGLGFEAVKDYVFVEKLGVIGKPLAWLVDLVLPAEQIFILGYLICATLAFLQILITMGVYFANAVNPLRGVGFISLVFIFALSWMPLLGIFPWVFIWMFFVAREHITS